MKGEDEEERSENEKMGLVNLRAWWKAKGRKTSWASAASGFAEKMIGSFAFTR